MARRIAAFTLLLLSFGAIGAAQPVVAGQSHTLQSSLHFLHTSASAGYLASQGEIPEMIVVAIDSTIRITP